MHEDGSMIRKTGKSHIFLHGPYFPSHELNRMQHEGDVGQARRSFLAGRFRNLDYLLRFRYEWMNDYIDDTDAIIIEIGAGAGFSELYLNQRPILTDAVLHPWIDKILDATNMDLQDESVDVIIASHTLHHFYSPYRFFMECARVLKPGGKILIQELNTSLALRVLLRLMRHEGFSYDVNVFDSTAVVNDPADLWSANCAVPEMIFECSSKFERTFPEFKIIKNLTGEFMLFPLSGGVIAKTPMPELPHWALKAVMKFDKILTAGFPKLFAMGRSVAVVKV
jgi:SAM-dependent methyltransferase